MSKFDKFKEIASYLNPVKTGKAAYNKAGGGAKGALAGIAAGGAEAVMETAIVAGAVYAAWHQYKYGYPMGWDDIERLKVVLGYGQAHASTILSNQSSNPPSSNLVPEVTPTPEVPLRNATDNATSAISTKSAAFTNHTNISAPGNMSGEAYINVKGSKITEGLESHLVETTADTCRAVGNSSGFVVETGNGASTFSAGARC